MNTYEYLAALRSGADPEVDRETVRRAIDALRRGEPADPAAAGRRIVLLMTLTGVSLRRFERSNGAEEIEDAVSAARTVVELEADKTASPDAHSNLAAVLKLRYERFGEPADLEEALAAARTAVERCPPGDAVRGAVLLNLAGILRLDADVHGADRDAVLHTLREARAASVPGSPHHFTIASDLIAAETAFASRSDITAGLDGLLVEALELLGDLPDEHSQRPKASANVAEIHRVLYAKGAGEHHLDAALRFQRAALLPLSRTHRDRPTLLVSLGMLLVIAHERRSDPAILAEAVDVLGDAADAVDSVGLAPVATNLAGALHTSFVSGSGNSDDLDNALIWARRGIAGYRPDHPDHSAAAVNLAAVLVTDHREYGGLPAIEEAVTLLRSALTPRLSAERRAQISANLAIALRVLYQRIGVLEELNSAVEAASDAVELTPPTHGAHPRYASLLSSVLRGRFEAVGDGDDLDRAIEWSRIALRATPSGHAERPRRASQLSLALMRRFEASGDDADLDDAVRLMSEAVDLLDAAAPLGLRARANLGDALRIRYEYAGELSDLDDAIVLLRDVVANTGTSSTALPARAAGLGALLLRRFEATSHTADIDQAVSFFGRAACRTTKTDPARPMFLSNVGLAFFRRFESSAAPRDLHAAVAYGRAAIRLAPTDSPMQPGYRSSLIVRLLALHERGLSSTALDEAAYLAEELLAAIDPENQSAAGALFNCGLVFEAQAASGDADAGQRALAAFRRCAEQPSAPPLWRAMAAGQCGRLAGQAGDWDQACADYAASIRFLPRVAHRALSRASKQTRLGRVNGVGRLAAAAALHVDDAQRALSLLEQGRCVVLGQDLDYRGELGSLVAQDPESAESLARLRSVLSDDDGPGRRRRSAAQEWERLVARVRESRPGLRKLFLPPEAAELAEAARGGRLVAVNIAPDRCDALVLSEQGLEPPIPLPTTEEQCREAVNGLLDALEAGDWHTNRAVDAHLRWLWENITGPILEAMGLTRTPQDGEPWPRVWWMPTGPLALAPLHAAGHHDETGPERRTVVDRVVSSYTPTIRALAHSRAQATDPSLRPLVVGVTDTPGQRRLVRAAAEAEWVASRLGAEPALIDAEATSAAVAAGMAACGWLHFAGHSITDVADSSENALLLPDGALRVGELAALHNPKAYLAYLSSCKNARPGARLPDESIHVASSMQLTGFAHIIGTLWNVGDDASYDAARQIYPHLLSSVDAPAVALHAATRSMRDRYPRNPVFWAAYVHIGA